MHPTSPPPEVLPLPAIVEAARPEPSDRLGLSRADLGPLRVSVATLPATLASVETAVRGGAPTALGFCEANLLSHAVANATVRQALARFDALFADGIALIWLARLHGVRLPQRIPGPSFILAACEHGVSRGWRHFFYGGAPGVTDALVMRLQERFPGLIVAGTYSPPFRDLTAAEDLEVKRMIEESRADLLWVGLGGPKQELWIADHLGRIRVPVMLAVGAAFDFHSGRRPWAPCWIRRIGMEWLYRTVTGGRKTFVRNVRCVTTVALLLAKAAAKRPKPHKSPA